jgi:hypothetical protein
MCHVEQGDEAWSSALAERVKLARIGAVGWSSSLTLRRAGDAPLSTLIHTADGPVSIGDLHIAFELN